MTERHPLSDAHWDGTTVVIPDNYVELDGWQLIHEHGKSYLLDNSELESSSNYKKQWLPISQVVIDQDDSIWCVEWLAQKEGLIC